MTDVENFNRWRDQYKEEPMSSFQNENMCEISYEAVIEACDGQDFPMQLVGEDTEELQAAVNQGIDSHLEACAIAGRDTYTWLTVGIGNSKITATKLHCSVSPESLPVLLRRLFEADPCSNLGSGILGSLGFNDEGQWAP